MRFADHQIQNVQIFTAIVQQSRSLAQQQKSNVQQKKPNQRNNQGLWTQRHLPRRSISAQMLGKLELLFRS